MPQLILDEHEAPARSYHAGDGTGRGLRWNCQAPAGENPSRAVKNPSGVCRGYETNKPACLTAPAWIKPQTPTRRGFRLMPVSHSVKAWSKWNGKTNTKVDLSIVQPVRG